MTHNVVILGSGPAGLTAAIYTARAELQPLVIDGPQMGGQLMITTEVDNYPGFKDGIMGPQLMTEMRAQAERFGTQFKNGLVESVDLSKRPFTIKLGDDLIETQTIIVATGASARWLGLESETKLRGKGVSACATCDGFFFKNRKVLVVGGGDTAIEEALFLTKFASSVTIVHRRNELRASKAMQKRAFDNEKIHLLWDSVIEDILDVNAGVVTGATIKHVKTGETHTEECEGVFMAIGHVPNTTPFKDQIDMNEVGYITTQPGSTYTSVPGVFAAGDVADHVYRQAISAAGTGCMAAIDAERYLGEL